MLFCLSEISFSQNCEYASKTNRNETTSSSSHRHIFRSPIFTKMLFRRDGESVYFLINSFSSGNFLIFQIWKLSEFFAKKINFGGKKTFLRNNVILYDFFKENFKFYSQKNLARNRKIEKSYHFRRILRQICNIWWLKKSYSEPSRFMPDNW